MSVELQVLQLRAHKGHTQNHGPSGSIPLADIGPNCFLIAEIRFIIDGKLVAVPGVRSMGEYYADVFLAGLVNALTELRNTDPLEVELAYHYDQGEPIMRVSRSADSATLSLIEDEGRGDRWDFECRFDEFEAACEEALAFTRGLLVQHAGSKGERYFQECILNRSKA